MAARIKCQSVQDTLFIHPEFANSPQGSTYKGYTAFIPSLSANSDFSKPHQLKSISCDGCKKQFSARKRTDSQSLIPCKDYFIHCICQCMPFLQKGTFKACDPCRKIFLTNRSFSAHRRNCSSSGEHQKPKAEDPWPNSSQHLHFPNIPISSMLLPPANDPIATLWGDIGPNIPLFFEPGSMGLDDLLSPIDADHFIPNAFSPANIESDSESERLTVVINHIESF